MAAAGQAAKPARIIDVSPLQSSLDLWEPICLKGDPDSDEPLLLLPEGYTIAGKDPLQEIGKVTL